MRYEYMEISGKSVRLTVTPERVTIKLNPRLYDKYKAISKCLDIAEKMIPVEKSYRGKFSLNSIKEVTMWDAHNKHRLFIDL